MGSIPSRDTFSFVLLGQKKCINMCRPKCIDWHSWREMAWRRVAVIHTNATNEVSCFNVVPVTPQNWSFDINAGQAARQVPSVTTKSARVPQQLFIGIMYGSVMSKGCFWAVVPNAAAARQPQSSHSTGWQRGRQHSSHSTAATAQQLQQSAQPQLPQQFTVYSSGHKHVHPPNSSNSPNASTPLRLNHKVLSHVASLSEPSTQARSMPIKAAIMSGAPTATRRYGRCARTCPRLFPILPVNRFVVVLRHLHPALEHQKVFLYHTLHIFHDRPPALPRSPSSRPAASTIQRGTIMPALP